MTDSERAELTRLLALRDDEQLPIAGKAWNAVKQPGDGSWADLSVEIRGKLNDLAEKYAAGRAEQEGDYAPAGFRDEVRGLTPVPFVLDPRMFERNPILQGDDLLPDNRTARGFSDFKDGVEPHSVETFIERRTTTVADRRVGKFPSMIDPDRREGVADRRSTLNTFAPNPPVAQDANETDE